MRRRILRTNIDVVLDIGANVGQYAKGLRADGYAGRIVSFEPLSEAFAELSRYAASDKSWECKQLALGNSDGTTNMNISERTYSNSLLPMKDRHLAAAPNTGYVGSETVRIKRLDSLRNQLFEDKDSVYTKLDVQGYEMQVLEGATEILGQNVPVVEIELSTVPLYEGQPLFYELSSYLYARGFDLVSIEPTFFDPESNYVLQMDGIFVRQARSLE